MIISHFTSRHSINRIKQEGITRGKVPWKMDAAGKVTFMSGLQWLTMDSDWDQQDWDQQFLLAKFPVRRTDFRITVGIPSLASHQCIPWDVFCRKHGLQVDEYFQTFASRRWWYVYLGNIPPSWILESVRNPEVLNLADVREI